MVTTFFYAQKNPGHEQGISSFSVAVRAEEDGAPDKLFQVMLDRSKEISVSNADPAGEDPVFVGYAGIPDLVVVIRAGGVYAAYYRNSVVPPCMVVHDLDLVDDEIRHVESLQRTLSERGYVRCAALEADPE